MLTKLAAWALFGFLVTAAALGAVAFPKTILLILCILIACCTVIAIFQDNSKGPFDQ